MTRAAAFEAVPLVGLPAPRWAPGFQWAVGGVQGSSEVLAGGLADLPVGTPVTADTAFLSCSTTKFLTAVLILQASDRGELSLDGILTEYLSFVPYRSPISIRMLLSHRSGLRNPNPMSWVHSPSGNDDFDENQALVQFMLLNPAQAMPGRRYRYSNLGYWLLGHLLERTTGKRFAKLLAERVWLANALSFSERRIQLRSDRLDATLFT